MKKKGFLNQVMIVLIIVVVIIVIMGLFTLGSIVLPIIAGEGAALSSTIQSSVADSGVIELQNATQVSTDTVINVLGVMEVIVYLFFMGLVIGFIFIAYYVKTYPFLAWFWIGIMAIVVIMAMIMSNIYQEASVEGDLSSFYTTWGTNDLLMNYLPHIFTFIGVFGGVILFVIISRDSEVETSTQL